MVNVTLLLSSLVVIFTLVLSGAPKNNKYIKNTEREEIFQTSNKSLKGYISSSMASPTSTSVVLAVLLTGCTSNGYINEGFVVSFNDLITVRLVFVTRWLNGEFLDGRIRTVNKARESESAPFFILNPLRRISRISDNLSDIF